MIWFYGTTSERTPVLCSKWHLHPSQCAVGGKGPSLFGSFRVRLQIAFRFALRIPTALSGHLRGRGTYLLVVPLVSAVAQTYHFTPLSFAENMAAMLLFSLIVAVAARSQLKVEKS